MTFIPPTDDDGPNRGRAAAAFLFGLASFGTGASAGMATDSRTAAPPPTRGQRIRVNLVVLACYAAVAGGAVIGWQVEPSLVGIALGLFVSAGVICIFGVVLGVFAVARRGVTRRRSQAGRH